MSSLVAQMVKNLQCKKPRFNPWVGKFPWRGEGLPTPVFLPGEFHGQSSQMPYSPWGGEELETNEQLTLSFLSLKKRKRNPWEPAPKKCKIKAL